MSDNKTTQVLDSLRTIIDPDLGKDIVSCGFVKDLQIAGGQVTFTLELTTPACPLKSHFVEQCEKNVGALDWVSDVKVTLSSRPRSRTAPQRPNGLAGVHRIVAVSSCKGGVGKSTVAVNLGYALAQAGATVGILDADIFGPSLPVLVRTDGPEGLQQNERNLLVPKEAHGVKLMSFGYAAPPDKAAIMRGPMVSGLIDQLALGTDWGELDYLVVDMPPGTGDIQLTLTQRMAFDGAVIVTTPQQLSLADVVRGIQMFSAVNVPIAGIAENMSYFVCDRCESRHYPFGQGAVNRLAERYGVADTWELPLTATVSTHCDTGVPLVLDSEAPLRADFLTMAEQVAQAVERLREGKASEPEITYVAGEGIVVRRGDERRVIPPADLRRRCTCAHCVDEHTGEPLLNPADVPDDVEPVEIQKMGNYAVAIRWSDGHDSSIYPYDKL